MTDQSTAVRPCVVLGASASQQWQDAPEHLAMVLARYRAAAALIGAARTVLELGCGEGIGARILASGRELYHGLDVDPQAITTAKRTAGSDRDGCALVFGQADVTQRLGFHGWTAVVALDLIEHLSRAGGERLLSFAVRALTPGGVFVVGTPNQRFDDLASPQSKAAHITTYCHSALYEALSGHFRVVQAFGLQDTALHLGHPDARHYLLFAGIGPR
jgi:2-polyprenyl-3-methyl-5-hydroxy-6-metoxy-1,4-benzoquinol methylase